MKKIKALVSHVAPFVVTFLLCEMLLSYLAYFADRQHLDFNPNKFMLIGSIIIVAIFSFTGFLYYLIMSRSMLVVSEK